MSDHAASAPEMPGNVTLEVVYRDLLDLRERVEDLEDLQELDAAIARNKGKKLIPWAAAKKQLGLES